MKTRQWFRIHSFTGVITGLLLFVICWSGTFAVLAHEMDWLVTPQMRVEPQSSTASWGEIEQAASRALAGEIAYLEAPLSAYAATRVWIEEPDGNQALVWVNPYNADVVGVSDNRYTIQRFFRNFHRLLSIPSFGIYLVTLFSITMLVSAVAALFVYKRWWTRFFRFKKGKPQIFWSELHKLAGVWSLWFVLLMGLTGAWYLFEASRADFVDGKVNFVGNPSYSKHTVPEPQPHASGSLLPLDELLKHAREAWPELEIRGLGYEGYSGSPHTLYVAGQTGFPLVRNRSNQMHLDRYTGEILWQNSASDLPLYWLWSNMADPLHFGNFAGLTSKIIWFLFGLILCGLILSGTYLHARRLARSAGGHSRHRWPGTLSAVIVSILILMAAVPSELMTAREYYGRTADGVAQLPELTAGVKAIIVSWVALTVGAIAGWIWMLWRPASRGPVGPAVAEGA